MTMLTTKSAAATTPAARATQPTTTTDYLRLVAPIQPTAPNPGPDEGGDKSKSNSALHLPDQKDRYRRLRLKLRGYYRLIGVTQAQIAAELGHNNGHFSRKVNLMRNQLFSLAEAKSLIYLLARREAVTYQWQALELLELFHPGHDFTVEEWRTPPLNHLAGPKLKPAHAKSGGESEGEGSYGDTGDPTGSARTRKIHSVLNTEILRLKVRSYLKIAEMSERKLAVKLGMMPHTLTRKLYGRDGQRFSPGEARALTKALSEWGAITSRREALELMELAALVGSRVGAFGMSESEKGGYSFSDEEWDKAPLNRLKGDWAEPRLGNATLAGAKPATAQVGRVVVPTQEAGNTADNSGLTIPLSLVVSSVEHGEVGGTNRTPTIPSPLKIVGIKVETIAPSQITVSITLTT